MTKTASYGTWSSPITSDALLENAAGVDETFVDPITSVIYHIEKRPSEGGRNAIVVTEENRDLLGKDWNVRTEVHSYGGAPAIAYGGVVYFSHFKDSRVYMVKDGGEPEPITPEDKPYRYARFTVHPTHTHLLVSILEDHTNDVPSAIVNTLCVINTKAKSVTTIVYGADFYSHPSFSPDGSHLVWQQWNHPDMPWEGSEIYCAKVSTDGSKLVLDDVTYVAGKAKEISASYPFWASSDVIMFTSDISGFQNPWKYTLSSHLAAPVLQQPVEQDFAQPGWRLDFDWGVPLELDGKMALYTALKDGRSVLYVVSLVSGTLEEIDCPYVDLGGLRRVAHDAVVFNGATSQSGWGVILCSIKEYGRPQFTALNASAKEASKFPPSYISAARAITIPIPPNNEPVYVLYLPPKNPEYEGPVDEKPPCIVDVHGGPTGRASPALSWSKQFWTTRGWAWLDVNYGGSSGQGRQYINRLAGQWGVVDVEDCVHAAQRLSSPPYSLIDPKRIVITGQSSGGFTVLAALCNFPDVFAAATSSFGISNLYKLAEFTHKFESHYPFKLIGGTPDEVPQIYHERSPVFHADKIKSPLLVLQGSDDAVVPPGQAEEIVNTIKKRGGRVEYVVYQGEGHGWRKAETIKDALEKELAFYRDVLRLAAADP
ncbi:alpha/beta-hydrolase [Obba rivulosa]|uniref:Alpha/beta-hydrolase n=1 Tax=Obba rivulosa TaxID=1052685 RepID=A0A8E2AL70_9APHY|nr:alpha/beta-hydrolase [Obba rivulosa]